MKQKVSKCIHAIDTFSDWVGRVLSYGEYIMLFALLFEVISRYFFNSPTVWSNEFSMYIFGALGVLSGGYVLTKDQHIKVDIFYSMYPKRAKAIVDCVAVAFIVFWGILIIYYGWPYFLKTFARNELSITSWRAPLWPIRLTVPVAGVLLIVAAISKLMKSIYTLATGEEI